MTVVTRFAPSPTGFLHIGGARTALFNWLYARHMGGKYLLRIEDTDRARSSEAAVAAIIDGLDWLNLSGDEPPLLQHSRIDRHAAIARDLLAAGKAYYCYCSPEELTEMREAARKEGKTALYDGRWRDRDPAEAPAGIAPVIRLKTPHEGVTVIADKVQGEVTVENRQIDDFILLRADGTPTYMHSVAVDDHDMGVTHVIRGDDHLNNAFRQAQLFKAMEWPEPVFAHIPLIHGQDGGKLSKRHGALGVEAWREMGYLPEALCSYLVRLGWGHGDQEIVSRAEAVEWFELEDVGRAPSRFDAAKLDSVNSHYLRRADDARLAALTRPILEAAGHRLSPQSQAWIREAIPGVKERAKTLCDLADTLSFYAATLPLTMTEKAAKLLTPEAQVLLRGLAEVLTDHDLWDAASLEALVRAEAERTGAGLGAIAQPLRAALTGSHASPSIFEVLAILGRAESLARLKAVC